MRRQFFSTTVSFNCVCPHVNAFDNFTAVTNEDLCLWDIQFHGYNRLHFLSIIKWVILRSFILVKFGKKSHFKFQATGFEGLWIPLTVLSERSKCPVVCQRSWAIVLLCLHSSVLHFSVMLSSFPQEISVSLVRWCSCLLSSCKCNPNGLVSCSFV